MVDPSVLHFAGTQVGTTAAAQTVTVTNVPSPAGGNVPLVIDGIEVPGPAGADYPLSSGTISNSCFMPASGGNWSGCNSDPVLDAGQSVTFQVAFAPGSTGSRYANLTVVGNDTNPYTDIALYGVGT